MQDVNFDGFPPAELSQQRISRLQVVMKKSYNFPNKPELSKFILHMKISWLIFSAVSEEEMKNLQRSERALVFQREAMFFRNLCYMHDLTSGGSTGGAPSLALFWVKKGEMTDGRRSSWAGKIEPCPFLSTKSGSATAQMKTNMK